MGINSALNPSQDVVSTGRLGGGSLAWVISAGAQQNTLLAAASNTKGAILRTYMVASIAGGQAQLYCSTAIPTGTNDTGKLCFCHTNGGTIENAQIDKFIPAGFGLYAAFTVASEICCVGWDLLP